MSKSTAKNSAQVSPTDINASKFCNIEIARSSIVAPTDFSQASQLL